MNIVLISILIATIGCNEVVELQANIPYQSEIAIGDQQTLSFSYEKHSKDIALMFSVSSAGVQFYVSSHSKCEPITKECADFVGSSDKIVRIRGHDLHEGKYTILIIALQSVRYTFTASVSNSKNANVVQLQEGQQHRAELRPGDKDGDIAYFQFEVDFEKEVKGDVAIKTSKPDIQINVIGARYKIAVTVNKGDELPSSESFHLISMTGNLIIQPHDHYYIKDGMYSVAVQFFQHDTLENIDKDTVIPFSITFTTSRTLKYLDLNQPVYDTVMAGSQSTYFFLWDDAPAVIPFMTQKKLLLTKQHLFPENAQLRIYLGAEPQRSKSDEVFELSLRHYHQSTYEIQIDTIQKLCGESLNVTNSTDTNATYAEVCEIYIFVENHSDDTVRYSLTVWNPDSPIELHEGKPQKFNLDSIDADHFLLFQYKPNSYSNDLQIILQSYFGEISYKMILLNLSDKSESELEQFEAPAHNVHSRTISPTAFQNCKPQCMLEIYVTPKAQEIVNDSSDRVVEYDDTFSIVVSQKFLDIRPGQHIEMVISSDQPRYFIYEDVRGIVEDKENTLVITLHEFIGQGAMCIALSDDEYLRMPFRSGQKMCDFEVKGNRLELGSKNISYLLDQEGISIDNNPVLIIEISAVQKAYKSASATKFELLVEKSNEENKPILVGTPYRVQISENSSTTITYFNYLGEDIEIQVTRVSGYGWLTINYCLDDKENDCEWQTVEAVSDLFMTGQSQTNIVIKTTDEHFCVYCTYSFFFATSEAISLLALLTVTSPSQFVRLTQGVTFLDYLNEGEKSNIYRVAFDTHHQIEVAVKVYEGDPELYIGYKASYKPSKYEFGPFNVEKFKAQLSLKEYDGNFFEAILPPRQHLLENHEKYNISAELTLANHFVEDDLYLLVKSPGKNGVNYTILVTQGTNGASNSLEDGVISQVVLSRMKPSQNLFYYHLTATNPLLILRAVFSGGGGFFDVKDFIQVTASVREGDDHTNTVNEVSPATLQLYQIHPNQISYKMPSKTGLYEIVVTNKIALENAQHNNNLQMGFDKNGNLMPNFKGGFYAFGENYLDRVVLDVAINSQDLFLMEPNRWVTGSLSPGQANFYETFIPKAGILAVHLQNCEGDLKFSYSRQYQTFLKEEFDSSTLSMSGYATDTLIDVNQGPIYLAIHSNTDSEAHYNFITTLTQDSDDIPHGHLLLGGDGQITWSVRSDDSDSIDVYFKPLKCLQCDLEVQQNSHVNYEIIWSTQLSLLNHLGKCGAEQYLTQQKTKKNFNSLPVSLLDLTRTEELKVNINVDSQSESEQIFLSVRAIVNNYKGKPIRDYKLFYQTVQVGLPKNLIYLYKHKREEFALGAAILIIFILGMLCCLCYFYKKLKGVKRAQLELELEKRMVKAMKKQEEQSQKYGQLEEETIDQNL